METRGGDNIKNESKKRINTNRNETLTVNLSSTQLSAADISLLDKGLSFVPVPKTLPLRSVLETKDRLVRNIKIKSFFGNCTNTYRNTKKLFRAASTWTPQNNLLEIDTLATVNEIDRMTIKHIKNSKKLERNNDCHLKLKNKPNLTAEESKCISKLRTNPDIIIKEADKGGATVIMDINNYIYEANRQLNDIKYYKPLQQPIFHDNIPKIRAILEKMKSERFIDKKQLEFLSGPENPRNRIFYLLPKIHKDKNKWSIPDRMPEGRPIVSDVESESYRVSQMLDHFLTPLAVKHPTYLKNTYDFVNKIRNQVVEADCFIITGDVSALYTNMQHVRTVTCVKEIFKTYPDPTRPDKHLLDLLNVTLKNNDFQFNGNFYLQTCGTPMGKVYAPALANLYLLEFDDKATNGFRIKPDFFFRFLDDIFCIMTGTENDIKEYETYLNSLIPGIRVTLEYSKIKANFLDTTIYKKTTATDTTLQTKVYFKPTDTHQLLHVDSLHPKHTCKGILKSQLIRFKRISSSWEDYTDTCKILFHSLGNRGYTWSNMWNMLKTVWFNRDIGLTTLRNSTYEGNTNGAEDTIAGVDAQGKNNFFPIITHFDSLGVTLTKEYRKILKKNKIFNKFRLINAHKIHSNLKKLLVRSELTPHNITTNTVGLTRKNTFSTCSSTRCNTCKFSALGGDIFSSSTFGATFHVVGEITCRTLNIIYLITCLKCNIQYVGETGRCLADRLNDHRSNIKNKKDTPIGIHFNKEGHNVNRDLKAIAIEKIEDSEQAIITRKKQESSWQTKLGTKYPWGLNGYPV